MPDLRANADWTYRGLRVVTLENRYLRVLVLPEVGAKIWQITYKPSDADLLWNNSRNHPTRLALNSRYDDVWSGGWDELFPNDEVAIIGGEAYPDHGELWTGHWDFEPFSSVDEAGVTLRFLTPISCIQVEKTDHPSTRLGTHFFSASLHQRRANTVSFFMEAAPCHGSHAATPH